MSVTHATRPVLARPVITPDPIDRFLDMPLPRAEAAHVLAHYLPLVVDYSPSGSYMNEYLIARLHCAAAIGYRLGRSAFLEAALVAEQYENRRRGREVAPEYVWWTVDAFHDAIATRIDLLLDGAK